MWSALYKQTSAGSAAPCARENVVLTTRGNIQTCHSYWFYQYISTGKKAHVTDFDKGHVPYSPWRLHTYIQILFRNVKGFLP